MKRKKATRARPEDAPDSAKADLMQVSGHAKEGADGHGDDATALV